MGGGAKTQNAGGACWGGILHPSPAKWMTFDITLHL